LSHRPVEKLFLAEKEKHDLWSGKKHQMMHSTQGLIELIEMDKMIHIQEVAQVY
jgi:hypothetical protein